MFVGKSKGYEMFPKDFDIEDVIRKFENWTQELNKKKVSESDSLYAIDIYKGGIEFYNEKKYEEASWEFSYAIELNPYFYEAQYYLAKSYLFDDQYYNAYFEFEDLIDNSTDFDSIYLYLAQAYFYAIYIDDAQYAIDEFLTIHPDSKLGMYWNAKIQYYNGYETEAIDVLEEILAIDPNYSLAYTLLGEIYYNNENYTKSITLLKKALNNSPRNFDLNFSLGDIYYNTNNIDSAIFFLETCTSISPENDNAYNLLALSYIEKFRYTEALETIEIALEYNSDIQYIRTRGKIYFAQADYKKANIDFQECYYETSNSEYLILIAECYENTDDIKDAIEYYSLYLEELPYDDANRTSILQKIESLDKYE